MHVVLCPNEQPSFEPFLCLDLVLPMPSLSSPDFDEDVGLYVLGCRVDILGTNCNRPILVKCSNL